jgi:hypothetical protein
LENIAKWGFLGVDGAGLLQIFPDKTSHSHPKIESGIYFFVNFLPKRPKNLQDPSDPSGTGRSISYAEELERLKELYVTFCKNSQKSTTAAHV